jgi:prepilin-type N-terminal cleavage/methylation domain-containing protein
MWARRSKDESGFTLTELLIVIVILGILTGIVVFAVGAFADRGAQAACKSDEKAVEVAVEAYQAKTGHYPVAATSDARIQLLVPDYLREAPRTDGGYTITLNPDGSVSATGACAVGPSPTPSA